MNLIYLYLTYSLIIGEEGKVSKTVREGYLSSFTLNKSKQLKKKVTVYSTV